MTKMWEMHGAVVVLEGYGHEIEIEKIWRER